MAATWIKPVRANKGKSIAQTITASIKYVTNVKKTGEGHLVRGYACNPRTAETEFLLAKQRYETATKHTGRKRDILLYHVRQSFKPGEITPEKALELGHDLAMRFTKGNHAFVVSAHTDKSHIHCHIMFHAVNIDATKKFRNPIRSHKIVRRISDHICLENGLSVIENPKPSRGSYGTWLGDKKEPNYRESLRALIAETLTEKPSDFDVFIKLLEAQGCEFNRKRMSIRMPTRKGFIRLRSLGNDFSETAIREQISGKRVVAPPQKQDKLSLLIDLQNSIKAQNSPGYAHWARVFSIKQAAKTLLFLQESGLTDLEKLDATAQSAKDDFNALQTKIHAIDSRLKSISSLQKHIGAYGKTKDVFQGYRHAKNKRKYYIEHEDAIETCKAAKSYFNSLGLEKIPTIKSLKQEYATLSAEKRTLYSDYHVKRDHMQKVLMARQNVSLMLGDRKPERDRER